MSISTCNPSRLCLTHLTCRLCRCPGGPRVVIFWNKDSQFKLDRKRERRKSQKTWLMGVSLPWIHDAGIGNPFERVGERGVIIAAAASLNVEEIDD